MRTSLACPWLRRGGARALVAAVVVLSSLPGGAWAGAGETEFGAGLGAGLSPATGELMPRAIADVTYNVGDLWGVGGLVAATLRPASPTVSAMATGRLIIDALTWVPALSAGVGVTSFGGGAWIARGAAEVAYRPSRSFAWFGRVSLEVSGASVGTVAFLELGGRWFRSPADDLDF